MMIGSRTTARVQPRSNRTALRAVRGWLLTVLACVGIGTAQAADDKTIRIGILQFGTVAWTLDTMTARGFDKAGDFKIEIVPMAASNAAQIALQGGAVDMITSDWLWVTRNRSEGRRLQFAPNSTALGGVYVRSDSGIKTVADLKGREIGVAGTPVDKSWLFLQAWARKSAKLDLKRDARPSFAAPPALNEFILRGKLPAVLNFWPYAARLKAAGLTPLIDLDDVLVGLGVDKPVPMVGWVFNEAWAGSHRELLARFLAAADKTNEVLRRDDAEWQRLRPLMKIDTDADFLALRDAHRAGIVAEQLKVNLPVMQSLYALLAAEGGEELVGKATTLDPQTFYAVPAENAGGKSGSKP